MARIPDEVIDRLKAEVSLARLVEAHGVALARHGADLIGLCPFHDDREPSLVVSPKNNLWHCLGACSAGGSQIAGGSVIDWVMRAQGVSFRHAVERLRADELPTRTAPSQPPARTTLPTLPDSLAAKEAGSDPDSDSDSQALLSRVIAYYHQTLKASPEALEYLARRGLDRPELIDRFRLGFSNRTLGYKLPGRQTQGGVRMREQLQSLGLLRGSGHEHFNGSLVVPVIDADGAVREVYGRKITQRLRKGTPHHLYLPGPHAGVFNEASLAGTDEVILCESLIDALTFFAAGFHNVTASYGTGGFTEAHLTAFRTAGAKRILIAYDRDAAGDTAAATLAEKLIAHDFDCYRVLFPKGMDANEYAAKVTPAVKSLGLAIRKAEWLGKGKAPQRSPVAAPLLTGDAEAADQSEEVEQEATGVEPSSALAAELAAEPQPDAPAMPIATAAVQPPMPADTVEAQVGENEVIIALGGKTAERRYRVRGLDKASSAGGEQLKVNILVSSSGEQGDAFHVDTLDLYAARQRGAYIAQAAAELGVAPDTVKRDLGRVLLKLEALQEERLAAANTPKAPATMSEPERTAALALLESPDLMSRLAADFARCGVVGEQGNTLVGYLSCVSRKLDRPLALIIQSTSAAGKSALMDAVLDFVPEEERIHYAAMTGQSLFYMGERDLKHKVLAIAEEAGVREASYALKILQSAGELTIASTGKDAQTGKLTTQEYRVEGPVMLFLTTTAIELDEELLNRCLVLSVNESRAQTEAIQARQRFDESLDGLLQGTQREAITTLHRNAQRLLRPLKVVNPYAGQLTFLSHQTRTRRDHGKYLTLIRAVTLLHQYQRPVRTAATRAIDGKSGGSGKSGETLEYIEATLADIETANRLAHEVLGRTLDELPPQTRRLLALIDAMVGERATALDIKRSDLRFSRRDVREATGWGHTQLKIHLHRLEEHEYLIVHRGGRGQSFVYELAWAGEGRDGGAFALGLVDTDALRAEPDESNEHSHYDANRSGVDDEWPGLGRPRVGPKSAGGRSPENAPDAAYEASSADSPENLPGRTSPAVWSKPSYRSVLFDEVGAASAARGL